MAEAEREGSEEFESDAESGAYEEEILMGVILFLFLFWFGERGREREKRKMGGYV